MSKVDNEVKIAEKVRFWEEQDQINKELIPRVVKNHELITDLTYQFEKNLTTIASLQSNMNAIYKHFENNINNLKQLNSKVEKKIDNLYEEIIKYEKYQNLIGEQGHQIQDAKLKLNKLQREIEDTKIKIEEENHNITKKSNNNLLISIGVVGAIILSIIGIII
ncbi:hypothetical protein R4Z10_08720 [Niallia sp. XMNu-256]|uniref:hypothetical protein n=1 Tax=Niallia sp. XMNu-256 TaxID=3082444 RepID=UPI0030D2A9F8